MNTTLTLSFLLLLTNICFGQSKNTEGYMPLNEGPNTAKYFKSSNSAYLDYYLDKMVKLGDHEYYAKVRTYSWGKTDTTYFREDNQNYYHFDPKTNSESVVLPKQIELGQKWFEADSSWSYEVIGINEKLKTPYKKHKGLIVIECVQLTDRDKQKRKNYHLYFAKGLGLVGSLNDGKLTSYLAEVKRDAKEGDKIGK